MKTGFRLIISTLAATALITGCSSSSESTKNATELADALAAKMNGNVTKVVTVTEANDPNDLLGKQNGYTSAAVLHDSRAPEPDNDETDLANGAKIEVFKDNDAAQARHDYINKIGESMPFVADGALAVSGNALLRVAKSMPNDVIAEYTDAWSEVS